jgi:hypothetical protein
MPGERRAGWHLLLVVLLGICGLTMTGCSAKLSVQSQDHSEQAQGHYGMGPPNRPLPPGQWEATGKVLVERVHWSNEPVGTVLKRPWTFNTVCEPACRKIFFRQTLYGPSETQLEPRGQVFTARFPPVRIPCYYPTHGYSGIMRAYGQSHDVYRLWWSSDRTRIHALERQVQTGCYKTSDPPTWTRWLAIPNTRWHHQPRAGIAF